MDTPTRENPSILIVGGAVKISRGYSLVNAATSEFEFVGAHDGPLVGVFTPNGDLLFDWEVVHEVIGALQAAAVAGVAPPGIHDAELLELGYLQPRT